MLILANLSVIAASQAQLASSGVIPLLVSFLAPSPGGLQQQAAAAAALCSLCAHAENRPLVAAAGAITPLIKLLAASGNSSDTTQAYAANTLVKLAADGNTLASFVSASAVIPLVTLLGSDSARAQQCAANVLMSLGVDGGQAQAISAAGGIPPLVRLLRSFPETAKSVTTTLLWSPELTQSSAVVLLRTLAAASYGNIRAMQRAGVAPLLDKLRGDAHTDAVTRDGATCLLALLKSASTLPLEQGHEGGSASLSSSSLSSLAPPLPPSAPSSSPPPGARPHHPEKKGKLCWFCGTTGVPLKKCSVCAVALYCDGACQKVDWKAHKGQCAGLKASAAACKE